MGFATGAALVPADGVDDEVTGTGELTGEAAGGITKICRQALLGTTWILKSPPIGMGFEYV